MKLGTGRRALVLLGMAAFSFIFHSAAVRAAESEAEPGLAVSFASADGKLSDTTVAPNVWLFVEAGQPPTPFLPAGMFTATWEGTLTAELRSDFFFQAELNGRLRLELNGAVALEAAGEGGASPLGKAVTLNKGANKLKAVFTSPATGDAFVRLGWTEKGTHTSPIPLAVLNHAATPEAQKGAQLRLGRELFLDLRCAKCHAEKLTAASVPELSMDAPSLEGISARRHYDWMARWILDPKSLRPSAQMPKLLAGPNAQADAEAIAAFLASLKSGGEVKLTETAYQTKQNPPGEGEEVEAPADDKPLYERLHCTACHNPPDAKDPDPKKLSQERIAEKFPAGRLADFLRAPEAHYAWTRMPNFHLSTKEAKELEDWLFAAAPKAPAVAAPTDASVLKRGRELVQSSGCLNCHALKLKNQFTAPALGALNARHLMKRPQAPEHDCLGSAPQADYKLTDLERAALDAFTRNGFASLSRHVPAEFAARQTRSLQCNACHGQIENFPPLEILGGKLKPEWAGKFIGGAIPHKMRYDLHPKGEPWLEARMPAFKSRAALLAAGLSAEHGYPAKSPAEAPVNAALAAIGQKLIGKEGGFSCVSCHAVGPEPAAEVFESEGINLACSADRLRADYYRRWLRSPLSIDPQTKMPAYFDEGKSPLTEVLDGDAEQQIGAVWEYLKLRDKLPPPNPGAAQ